MLVCRECGIEFIKTKMNQKYYCSDRCRTKFSNKLYRQRHPEKHYKQSRRNALKRKYGITLEDYTDLVQTQNGLCKICKSVSDRPLDVDHDHTTGAVRGLLCNKCNQAIGLLQDSPVVIKAALEYVGGIA